MHAEGIYARAAQRACSCKLGKLISDRNKRNTKDKNKLHKLDLYSKMLLKKRSKIEHVNNILKKNKTINTRYEKYSINYMDKMIISNIINY